uniref:SLC12 domain-containing protein n=1 Tax=Heterorhabditis bacteriophora TaxID=37862 RepID=A0A1I7XQ97_HETBA
MEKRQQMLKNDLRRSRSRGSGFINDAFNNDDTINGRHGKLGPNDSIRSTNPVIINITDRSETSFTDSPVDGLYSPSTPSDESDKEPADVKLNLHKMNTSVRLNKVILENSPDSQLVLLNLPHPSKSRINFVHSYMVYLEVLTENIKRVLFIGGSGKEVITIDS